MDELVIALAQGNPTVGDLEGNLALIRRLRAQAAASAADLVVMPELCVVGYPPEDLVLKPALVQHALRAVEVLAADTADGGPGLVVGAPWRDRGKLYNAAWLLGGGRVLARRAKHVLSQDGAFDETRVFDAGPVPGPSSLPLPGGRSVRLGIMMSADMWSQDVAEALGESGAELLIVINGSPFDTDQPDRRLQLAVARVTETDLPLIYVNQVGGQDELVFDGASFALDADRTLVAHAPMLDEAVLLTRWRRDDATERLVAAERSTMVPPLGPNEAIYRALVVGLRDHVEKNGFAGVVLGLSGGVDSALSAVVAVDALGPARVHAVTMPSRHTSRARLEAAAACAAALGIQQDEIPIEPAVAAFQSMLQPMLEDGPPESTEANLRSRVRGVILMGISNRLGQMVLATGNKSETAIGCATLCGELCSGYSALKDIYKTKVLELARFRNGARPGGCLGPTGAVIPERVIAEPASAELRPEHKDGAALPPYAVLDALLHGLIEEDLSPLDLVLKGFDTATVGRVSNLLDRAEYQRRRAPPGARITRKAFGRDRRHPITSLFRRTGIGEIDGN